MIDKVTIVGLYNYDDTILDGLILPEGTSHQIAVFTILERNGDFPLLYPDVDFMRDAIAIWSQSNEIVFNKMWATVTAEYNPLENYDRYSTIEREGSNNSSAENTDSQTSFNSIQFRETNKTESTSENGMLESVTEHTHGNVGVTSSQQMIAQEREIALFNFYDFIADMFARRFCIKVY